MIIRKPLPYDELSSSSSSVGSTSTLFDILSSMISSRPTPSGPTSPTTLWSRSTTTTSAPTSSLAPRTTDTSQPLDYREIIGIVVAIIALVVIASGVAFIAWRFGRKSPSGPSFTILPRRIGHHKSESSETLTSFDSTTDVGQRRAGRSGNSKQPAVNMTEVVGNVERLATPQNLAAPRISALNISTVSLPNYATPPTQSSAQKSVSHERGSSDPTNMYSQPIKLVSSDTALSRGHLRSQTFHTLPPLRTSLPTLFSQENSASDTASPYRARLLSPIPDSPVKTTRSGGTSQIPMSSNLTPSRDSPHSLASVYLDASMVTSPSSRKNRRGQSVVATSPTTSPFSFKARMKQGISPISVKSRFSVGTYLESKPLPPSPPGPPAPPPPFPPPVTPLIKAPKRSTPLRTAKSEGTVSRRTPVTPSSEGRAKPFNELLHSGHYYQRSISETSLRRYNNGKQSAHISSLVRPSFDLSREQSPKPVLRVDTSSPAKRPPLPPTVFTNTSLSSIAVTPTPISTVRSAPANMHPQPNPFIQTPISAAALSAINPPSQRSQSPRPISTAATTASTRPPLTPSGPFELSNDKDEKRDSLEPLPLAFPLRASRVQSQALSMSSTVRSTQPNTPTSASFLSIDPYEMSLSRNPSLNRSPSISVPIVFRFRMSKGKKNSMRRSARLT